MSLDESVVDESPFRSAFGGNWTDRDNATDRLRGKLERGEVTEEEARDLEFWIENGYVILEDAVPHGVIDAFNEEIEAWWATPGAQIKIEIVTKYYAIDPELRDDKVKILDLYVQSENARRAAFAPKICRFLHNVYERDPLLFQSLNFEHGTEQPLHQDTAYVPVSSPMELTASWIALEDIKPGSGELAYYPGSHRMREFTFSSGKRNWHMVEDGWDVHQQYMDSIDSEAQRLGLQLARFRPKKGDALIWSADLVHGGSAIRVPGSSRKSLVSHYCPDGVVPSFFEYMPENRTIVPWEGAAGYCSGHYPLG